jgi:hypothetical protein
MTEDRMSQDQDGTRWQQNRAHQTDWHRRDWGPPSMPVHQPRTQVTYRKMGLIAGTFHVCMMLLSCGLWTPVYLAARRGRKTVTRIGG